ncbi:hypothetical protein PAPPERLAPAPP_01440 [Brevundimonas phage vB_BpoS-Papperlapapp]|nr:hypothetical protein PAPPERLAPAPP_01440 [Brevundimonas phage vB_BpoS-Papperlapapp]
MKLSAISGLPALVILVTSTSGGLGASIHVSEAEALNDVVRELQADNDAPDDLLPTIEDISHWIAEEDVRYEFTVQPTALPGFRVVAFDHRTDTVLDNRIADTREREAAEHFAGMIWNQQGFAQPDRDVSVYLYRIGEDDPILTIKEDREGERTSLYSERGAYWYVDEVQGGERYTIAKNLTEAQARDVAAGAQPFDGVTGDLS